MYEMITRFDNQGKDYALGVEAGCLFEQMARNIPIKDAIIHNENLIQIQIFCRDMDYVLVRVSNHGPNHMLISAKRKRIPLLKLIHRFIEDLYLIIRYGSR